MSSVGRNSRKKKSNAFDSEALFFYAFNFLVIPFSGGMTYRGFERVLDPVLGIEVVNLAAVFIALITSLFFLAINFNIRENRVKGRPHGKQVLMYLVPLVFSTLGNFSAFYGDAMRGHWIKAEVEKSINEVKTLNDSIQAYKRAEEAKLDEIEKKYKGYLSSMDATNGNDDEPGCGRKCRGFWKDCKDYLTSNDIEVDDFVEISTSLPTKARDFSNQAFNKYAVEKRLSYDCADSFAKEYKRLQKSYLDIESLGLNAYKNSGCQVNDSTITSYNKLKILPCVENVIVSELPTLKYGVCTEFNTIGYLMEDAFITMPKPINTILYTTMALLLDLSSLLYVLIFVHPPRKLPGPSSLG